jgi:CRP-like cAMP-binding protein
VIDVKQAKLFEGLPASEVRSIEKQMKIVQHPAGHEIVVRGDNGVGFMVILDGNVSVSTAQGKTRKLGPGDSFGEMALLDGAPRTATVEAQTEVLAMLLGRSAFLKVVAAEPKIALVLMRTLAERLRASERSPAA